MSLTNDFYNAERDLLKEYYDSNRDIFIKADKGKIGKVYRLIVNPITFSVVQSVSMLYCLKNIKSNNKLLCISKIIGLTVLNANVFLFSYKHLNYPCNSFRLFRSFLNPLFTLQKDRAILSLLSINRFSYKHMNSQLSRIKPESSVKANANKITEGFL